ncbi:hypothetical protein BLOT_002919 [Blomia tropicalis]|nr:hypothetical protein BLOT_002919 [Blomia tropicalis]
MINNVPAPIHRAQGCRTIAYQSFTGFFVINIDYVYHLSGAMLWMNMITTTTALIVVVGFFLFNFFFMYMFINCLVILDKAILWPHTHQEILKRIVVLGRATLHPDISRPLFWTTCTFQGINFHKSATKMQLNLVIGARSMRHQLCVSIGESANIIMK